MLDATDSAAQPKKAAKVALAVVGVVLFSAALWAFATHDSSSEPAASPAPMAQGVAPSEPSGDVTTDTSPSGAAPQPEAVLPATEPETLPLPPEQRLEPGLEDEAAAAAALDIDITEATYAPEPSEDDPNAAAEPEDPEPRTRSSSPSRRAGAFTRPGDRPALSWMDF